MTHIVIPTFRRLISSRQLLLHPGSYCVVFDTFVEDMLKDFFATNLRRGKPVMVRQGSPESSRRAPHERLNLRLFRLKLVADFLHNRPLNPSDNPQKTVWEYLKTHPEFQIDKSIQHKLLITVAPDSYLQRVR